MPHPDDQSRSPDAAPAMQQATKELADVEDVEVISERATEIARERQELEDERHDEYDNPDEGGEG
jgi:hypothetical protein